MNPSEDLKLSMFVNRSYRTVPTCQRRLTAGAHANGVVAELGGRRRRGDPTDDTGGTVLAFGQVFPQLRVAERAAAVAGRDAR
jgi:hypothetical protein